MQHCCERTCVSSRAGELNEEYRRGRPLLADGQWPFRFVISGAFVRQRDPNNAARLRPFFV